MDYKGQGRGGETREEVKLSQAGGEGDLAKKGAGRRQEVVGFLDSPLPWLPWGRSPLVLSAMLPAPSQPPKGRLPWTLHSGAPQGSSSKLSLVSCWSPAGDVEHQTCKSNGLLIPLSGWATDLRNLVPISPETCSSHLREGHRGSHPVVQRRNLGTSFSFNIKANLSPLILKPTCHQDLVILPLKQLLKASASF